jgi:hypothetical protein
MPNRAEEHDQISSDMKMMGSFVPYLVGYENVRRI